jgi:hypothetical protein
MKYLKRGLLLALALVMLWSLAGCVPANMSPGWRIRAASRAMSKAKNYEFNMNVELALSSLGESMSMDASIKGAYFSDPLKMKLKLSLSAKGMAATREQYILDEGDALASYTKDLYENIWEREDATKEIEQSMAQYDVAQNMELYLGSSETFEEVGRERIGGQDTIKLKGYIPAELMENYMKNNFLQPQTDEDVLRQAWEQAVGQMDEVEVAVWINPRSRLPVRYCFDMTAMMQSFMEKYMQVLADTGEYGFYSLIFDMYAVTIDTMIMTVDIRNVNKTENFTLPSEIRGAA